MRKGINLAAVAAIALPLLIGSVGGAAAPHAAAGPTAVANPRHCDLTGGWKPADGVRDCMLPFPNNYFTEPDKASLTGRKIDFTASQMPVNAVGKHILPADWNGNDGFSVGSQLLAYVPGMTRNSDIDRSDMPRVDTIGRYRRPNAGVVVIDTKTHRRWPVWAELDQYTSEASAPEVAGGTVQQDLIIHPAINFAPATRYVVALRHVHLDSGKLAKPTAAFKEYRDNRAPAGDPRVDHFRSIFRTLHRAGIARRNLYLAWDFTTASERSTTGRLLAMRNTAFAQLGDTNLTDGKVAGRSPKFRVTNVKRNPSPQIARQVTGRFTVPCFVFPACAPTGKFVLKPGLYGTPVQNPLPQRAKFICVIPNVAYGKHRQLRPSLYGHGLFGSADEVEAGNVETMAQTHGMLECATNWYGMATSDVPNALADLADLSNFATLGDRVQQGELDFLILARLMIHPDGLCSNKAFRRTDGSCVIDRKTAYYDGNSQGGIFGGTVCAVIPDARRCVLGVPGQDYSVLLPRSSDFVATKPFIKDPTHPLAGFSYSSILDTAYPDQSQRMLVLDLIQMLWDRSDPDGYASRMTTDPLPGTPKHHVLLQMAWGDHQVTNIEAETEARTIGALLVGPPLVAGRQGAWRVPFWGLRTIRQAPYGGSALAVYDIGPVRKVKGVVYGTNPTPRADVPNRSGVDPHEAPRNAVCGQQQKSAFLRPNGQVTEPCGGPPYFAFDWDGKTGLSPHHI